jgi:hypothetical protein
MKEILYRLFPWIKEESEKLKELEQNHQGLLKLLEDYRFSNECLKNQLEELEQFRRPKDLREFQVNDHQLKALREKLKYFRITLYDVATDTGLTRRSIEYFFEGRHYNLKIHNACKRLISESANKELQAAFEKQKQALSIL